MLIGWSVIITSIGASTDVTTICDDEPMWRHATVPSSEHAFQNGSQCALWKLGHPSFSGFSEKVTAWQPFAAIRLTSAAISAGSQIGGSASGMNRPGYVPHHSSTCQSLYACNIASPTSLSFERANSWPQNCGNDGKHIEPSTPLAFMSRMRWSMS